MIAVDQLFARRTVMVASVLDDENASRIAAELMMLDALGNDPVDLWINCGGGTIESALMVMDVIDLLGVSVQATCLGHADGAAVGVLAVAHHRAAAPHSRVRFDAPASSLGGRTSDVARAAEELTLRTDDFCARVARATKQTSEWVSESLRARRVLEPVEALRVGLVDEIAAPRAAAVSPLFPNRARPLRP